MTDQGLGISIMFLMFRSSQPPDPCHPAKVLLATRALMPSKAVELSSLIS